MAHSDTIKSANLSKTKALRFDAALTTVIGQGTSFALSIVYLYRRREMFHFDFRPESFRPDAHTMGRLVGLGIPMSIQSMSVNLSKTVLMSWINSEGMIYSALAGIYNKTGMMFGIVSNSFTTAGSSMIGQNLGAGRNERVPKILGVVLSIGMGMATVFSALLLFQLPDRLGMEQTDRDIIQLMLDPVSEEQETR